jgi:hypothetical protein
LQPKPIELKRTPTLACSIVDATTVEAHQAYHSHGDGRPAAFRVGEI